jgi:hypothetical protein
VAERDERQAKNVNRFDSLSKSIARRSRRDALAAGITGIAAAAGLTHGAAAQEATPEPAGAAAQTTRDPMLLFVQTYQSGTITPIDGVDGRYTLSLANGNGQTVYFADRPERIVGTTETPQFLEGLGFSSDNPPNAALVVQTSPEESDVAVVELFSPLFDPENRGVTYEIEVLKNWQQELDMGFSEAPTDLAALAPSFGAARLFIDGLSDCPGAEQPMQCVTRTDQVVAGTIDGSELGGWCQNWQSPFGCYPCVPSAGSGVQFGPRYKVEYWTNVCNERFADCQSAFFSDGYFVGCYIYPRCFDGFDELCTH